MRNKLLLFCIGAAGYCGIEISTRGYSHWTMALTGGICFLGILAIAQQCAQRPLWMQALLGSVLVTGAELAVGLVINIWLGWQVWSYADRAMNVWGQICPLYTFYWFWLSLAICGGAKLARVLWQRKHAS